MVALVIWTLIAVGAFLYNHLDGDPFFGVLFTKELLGFPLNAGWLASAVALYCLIRLLIRRRRRDRAED